MDTAQQVTNQSGAGTQDATPTILVEMAMPANGAGFLQIRVCARNPVTKDTRAWWAVYWVKSNDAGVTLGTLTATAFVSVYNNGAQVAASEVGFGANGNTNGASRFPATCIAVTTVTAGQAIDIRWRSTTGTLTATTRTLLLLKVA